MEPVFQEILTVAIAKLEEGLAQETGRSQGREWDPDAWEQEVRRFTRRLGQQCLQTWANTKTQQAQEEARFCSCGQRRWVQELRPFCDISTRVKGILARFFLMSPAGLKMRRRDDYRVLLDCEKPTPSQGRLEIHQVHD